MSDIGSNDLLSFKTSSYICSQFYFIDTSLAGENVNWLWETIKPSRLLTKSYSTDGEVYKGKKNNPCCAEPRYTLPLQTV